MRPPAWSRAVRLPTALALALLLAGCLSSSPEPDDADVLAAIAQCRDSVATGHVLYFGPGYELVEAVPAAGFEPGNSFSSGFLTNDLNEWLSEPVPAGLWLVGDVTLEYWVRSTGTPAPLVLGGDPGEGYHFFNQFGSDRSLQPSYATEYATVAPMPGAVDHYVETLPMPAGGFVVEPGDRVRALLTDLALDNPDGGGHDILFGGETPSQVRFTARCFPTLGWPRSSVLVDERISLSGNQGLLTGGVPATEGVNVQTVDLVISAGTHRMSVRLTQLGDANPAKDDIDLVLVDADDPERTWGIGSPYSDEHGTLWLDNLAATFPGGRAQVQVNSYSGAGYEGRLVVTAERASLA